MRTQLPRLVVAFLKLATFGRVSDALRSPSAACSQSPSDVPAVRRTTDPQNWDLQAFECWGFAGGVPLGAIKEMENRLRRPPVCVARVVVNRDFDGQDRAVIDVMAQLQRSSSPQRVSVHQNSRRFVQPRRVGVEANCGRCVPPPHFLRNQTLQQYCRQMRAGGNRSCADVTPT